MIFHERWIADEQLRATAALAASTNGLPGEVIEIGVHQGLSAIPIANAVYPEMLYAVDHWDWQKVLDGDERYDPADHAGSLAKIQLDPETFSRDNYGIFLDNLREGTKGNVRIWKMDWREFAKQWTRPIRFLHLDAGHTTAEVSDNISALLPLAVPGAVFCGDDIGHPLVAEGVWRHFREVRVGPFSLWSVKL